MTNAESPKAQDCYDDARKAGYTHDSAIELLSNLSYSIKGISPVNYINKLSAFRKDKLLNNPVSITVRITIHRKGERKAFVFSKSYTMKEEFDDKPIKDGYAKAKIKFGNEDCVVQTNPITSRTFEAKIRKFKKMNKECFLSSKIYNPMQSSFLGYYKQNIGGRDVLLKDVNGGICYAVIDYDWLAEYALNNEFLSYK